MRTRLIASAPEDVFALQFMNTTVSSRENPYRPHESSSETSSQCNITPHRPMSHLLKQAVNVT